MPRCSGFEPLAEGPRSDEERRLILQQMKQQRLITAGMESPVAKACISGAVGFGLGAFLSLIGSTFAFDDPFRAPHMQGLSTQLKAKQMFVDMGKGMWRQGKGFGMVGALYSGTECVVEGVRCTFLSLPPSLPPLSRSVPTMLTRTHQT